MLLALTMAAPVGAAIAQSPPPAGQHTLTVRADNDAFDFWMYPWDRPDDEYTSGVHITYDGGDAPSWSRRFLRGAGMCVERVSSCRVARLELGQDIYTNDATVDSAQRAAARPNAGWLYLAQSARWLRDTRSDEVTLTLGVTGPPSLAELTQRMAHNAAPAFNRPTDWSRRVGFEPGAVVRYEQRRRLAVDGGTVGVDFLPRAAASLGNVLTAAELGFQTRFGWHLQHPWLPTQRSTGVAIFAGATAQAVARNLFLDGNTFGHGPRVGHEPFTGYGEMGIEMRFRRLDVAYRAVSDRRPYATGPKWHPWASMVAGFTFDR
jgi:lipid A 3-O-deacylase